MALLRALRKEGGGAPLNTEGMRRPATQRAGAFGILGVLVSIRGKTSDRQPWGCNVVIMGFDTAGANESSSTISIVDAVGDEPKSLPAWTLSPDGRILEITALRLPKQDDRGTACAEPIKLRAGVHAIDLTFSKIPSPIPPIGSIVEVTSVVAKASKGYISWNCQELCVSALHARLPAELAIAEAMPYGAPCLDLVGPSRIGDFSHTAPQTPLPKHPSDDFPAAGMNRAGGLSPVLRLEINRHMSRELTPSDDARDQRFILPPECMLLAQEQLDDCAMEHLDATTKIEPKIYQRTPEANYGKFAADLSLVSTFFGADHEPQQTVALVGRRLFAEPFCANAGAAIHPPLWEALTLPTAPDLKDAVPMVPHHLVVVPDYDGSGKLAENHAALTEYEQECQAAMEAERPKPQAPRMQLNSARVVGYIPRICEYAHKYGIPVSPQMVKRRFDASGARSTEVYSPSDLYANGPNKKFTRESFVKAQMLATGGYDPAKSMDKELFERPWTFQHHVGWVLADWQPDAQWIDQILGDERRSADWLWYALMLVKPESTMPYGTAPLEDAGAVADDPLAKVRPLPGCTLSSPVEGDTWILSELEARYKRMNAEKQRPFIGKNKNAAPLELLPDWRNIWMQTMIDPDVKHTLPIMVFVAVRANTKGMTVLGLKRGRDATAVKSEPSAKKFKNEKGEAVAPAAGSEDEEGEEDVDEMELDPVPSQ
jgi:hypothetical protein